MVLQFRMWVRSRGVSSPTHSLRRWPPGPPASVQTRDSVPRLLGPHFLPHPPVHGHCSCSHISAVVSVGVGFPPNAILVSHDLRPEVNWLDPGRSCFTFLRNLHIKESYDYCFAIYVYIVTIWYTLNSHYIVHLKYTLPYVTITSHEDGEKPAGTRTWSAMRRAASLSCLLAATSRATLPQAPSQVPAHRPAARHARGWAEGQEPSCRHTQVREQQQRGLR